MEDTANHDNYVGTTTPVTAYEKGQSFYGIQDAAGNVYQWCRDWYGTGKRVAKDPTGPESGPLCVESYVTKPFSPSIAALPNGRFLVAFGSEDGIVAAVFRQGISQTSTDP